MRGHPFKYFAYGVAAAEVEVDGFTGAYRTRRVDIVHDVGDSLSPLVDLGQIEGGFVQGAGWLTLEDLRWDESDGPGRGRLTTQAASTYKLPSFCEMPDELNVALLEQAHEDGAVYGSKAVGEPPLMLAFAVREALRQAAAAFGPPGTSVDLASPATPEAVFWAVERARRGGRARPCRRGPARRRARPAGPGRPPLHPRSEQAARARRRPDDALAGRGRAAPARSAGRASWSPSPTSAGMRPATPAPRWSSLADGAWGSVGGGNLEETAVSRRPRDARRRPARPSS